MTSVRAVKEVQLRTSTCRLRQLAIVTTVVISVLALQITCEKFTTRNTLKREVKVAKARKRKKAKVREVEIRFSSLRTNGAMLSFGMTIHEDCVGFKLLWSRGERPSSQATMSV